MMKQIQVDEEHFYLKDIPNLPLATMQRLDDIRRNEDGSFDEVCCYFDNECEKVLDAALSLLCRLMGDTTLRDVASDRKLFHGPYPGWGFPKLEVRHLAAIALAEALKLEIELPKGEHRKDAKFWAPEQWENFRQQVRDALKKRLEVEDAKPESKEPPADKPADIDRLIKQLGSNDFGEREAAHKALDTNGRTGLEALRDAAANAKDEEIRRRATILVDAIELGLDTLLTIYRDYDLPLQPKEAPLIKYEREGTPPSLAFLVKKGTSESDPIVFEGVSEFPIHLEHSIAVLDPKKTSAKELRKLLRATEADFLKLLYFAIQCKHAGFDDWADALLAESRESDPETRGPRSAVYHLAWNYWEHQIDTKSSDWSKGVLKTEISRIEERIREWESKAVPLSERLEALYANEAEREAERQKLAAEWPKLQAREKGEAMRRLFNTVTLFWDRTFHAASAKPTRPRKTDRPGRYSYALQTDRIAWGLATTVLGSTR